MVVFPVVPTLLYALLLLSPRTTAQDRRRYKLLERRAHECKSICGAIEAPIQLGWWKLSNWPLAFKQTYTLSHKMSKIRR